MIHTIGRADGSGAANAWIEKYIFPGGYVPALSEILPAIEHAGLYVTDIEVLRLHYAKTLKAWRQRFQANRNPVADIYDERFCRMWEFSSRLRGGFPTRRSGKFPDPIEQARRHGAVETKLHGGLGASALTPMTCQFPITGHVTYPAYDSLLVGLTCLPPSTTHDFE